VKGFDDELQRQLSSICEQGLYREMRRVDSPQGRRIVSGGRPMLNFSSNDYLGLANEPALKEAARKAIEEFGAGSGASRLICGSLAPHYLLEEAIAEFKATEAALSFSSGYAGALGTLGALLDKQDVVAVDKLVHASIVDAARLCGAKLRVFAHNDLDALERILKWADQRSRSQSNATAQRRSRTLIVTESVFSMDGDLALLREIIELKEKYGAWLMLDEAHATGLYGQNRRGLAEAYELADRVEIQMGTLGKAAGAAGGFICGSRRLIELLVNRARTFVFSTAPTPSSAAAATAGIRFVQSSEGETRRAQLWARVDQLKNGLVTQASRQARSGLSPAKLERASAKWELPLIRSAIIPLIVGPEAVAMEMAAALRERGIFIPAVRYPSVARGRARLRLTVTAAHSMDDVKQLLGTLDSL
jgi:8-amino-7-oxononanoate synthase